ncbi:MAG: hypothetical protein JEZ03_06700 [Bacteroidales bacterium]|nr:hypothetical protein [Bacteroidales bacterium]
MKKINILFAILSVVLVSSIAFASHPDLVKRPPNIGVHAQIHNNEYLIGCAEKVVLHYYDANQGGNVTKEQAYTGASIYHFSLGSSYSGDLRISIVSDCGVQIVSPVATGSWYGADQVNIPVYCGIEN